MGLVWLALVVSCALWPACRKQGGTDSERGGTEAAAPASQPTTAPDTDDFLMQGTTPSGAEFEFSGSQERAKQTFSGIVHEARHFVVLLDGIRIGHALFEDRAFQDHKIVRIQTCYWLFPVQGAGHPYAWISQANDSELGGLQGLKQWGQIWRVDKLARFALTPEKGWANIWRNVFGETSDKQIRIPEGYAVWQAQHRKLLESKGETGGKGHVLRLDWLHQEPSFVDRDYVFNKQEVLRTASGRTVEAVGYDVTGPLYGGMSEQVWFDGAGYPVRRVVKGKRVLDVVLCDEQTAADRSQELGYPQAVARFGDKVVDLVSAAWGQF